LKTPRHVKHISGSLWGLILITVVGGCLRFYRLGDFPLTHVEALTYWASQRSLTEIVAWIPTWEFHPPFFNVFMKAWTQFGTSESALRSLSALANTATIPLVFLLGRIVGRGSDGVWLGIGGALFFALSPLHLEYSQVARYHALVTLTATASLCGAAWLIVNPTEACRPLWMVGPTGPRQAADAPSGERWAAWLALILGGALSLWLHNLSVLVVFSLFLALLYHFGLKMQWNKIALANTVVAGLAILLLWSPFLYFLWMQAGNLSNQFWLPPLTFFYVASEVDRLFGVNHVHFLMFIPLAIAAAVGLWLIGQRRGWSVSILLAVVIALPIILVLTASLTVRPIFLHRTLIWVTIPYYVCVASGLTFFRQTWMRLGGMAVLAIFLLAGSVVYYKAHDQQDWDEVVDLISQSGMGRSIVFLLPNAIQLPFEYYAEKHSLDAEIVSLPTAFPGLDSPNPFPADTTAGPQITWADTPKIQALLERRTPVWLVSWDPLQNELFDPDRLLLPLLHENRMLVEEHHLFGGDLGVYRFEPGDHK